MIRRRLAVALVAATSTTLALVTPVQAQDDTGSSLDAVSTVSSLSSTDSTAPEVDEQEGAPVEMPEWAKSLELSDDAALAFEIVKAVMAVGLAVTQGAVIVLPFIPGGVDQLRNFLAQFGIQG